MRAQNQKFSIVRVEKDHQFTPFSSDNKPYDAVYFMEDYTRSSHICAYEITIQFNNETETTKRLALIGRIYGGILDCAVVVDSRLFVLVDDYLAYIDLSNLALVFKTKIFSFGTGIALYNFDGGLLVHGEIDIVKTDYEGKIEWTFSGRDIWVAMDGTDALRIEGNTIYLKDFNGDSYVLDRNGKEIQ